MKVAVPKGWAEDAGLDAAAELGEGFAIHLYDRDELAAPAGRGWDGVEALVFAFSRITGEIMAQLPGLRLIAAPGTGVWDYVDVPVATARSIAVCNIRDYAADAIAEFAIGLMITLSRRVPEADRAMRDGRWEPTGFPSRELRGRTLGLVGLGAIGTRVAYLGRALGMRVLCATRRPDPVRADQHGVEFLPLREVLAAADVVSLHASLTAETRGLIGPAEIAALRPGCLLINTARGGLVDQGALTEALRAGHVRGAALDVFETEPLPAESPLRQMPNVILTPHMSGSSTDTLVRAVRMTLGNVAAFQRGEPRNLVNPEVLS